MRTQATRTKFTATDLFDALTVRQVAELEHKRIAQRIKQARKEAGLTQQEMADYLQVMQRTYQNYESETHPRIPWDRMGDIEKITGKKVEWLLHGETPDPFASTGSSSTDEVVNHLVMIEAGLAAAAAERAEMLTLLGEIRSRLEPPPNEKTG